MPKKGFTNYINYAMSEFRTFDELAFNEVDSAIFSWLCYLLIHEEYDNTYLPEGMPLGGLLKAEYFEEMFRGVYWPEETKELLFAVASSPRYRGAHIKYYRNENDIETSLQFSAMTISFSKRLHYVAFRGTDKTIHGWKEDAMLLMSKAAPAKLMAVNYLDAVGKKLEGILYVGGHSKGGHMAVFAAAHCDADIQKRIINIFSHDGPGFLSYDIQYPGMKKIRKRIIKTIPESSIVGLLLKNECKPRFIVSDEKGAFQHYPGSWEVNEDHFVYTNVKPGVSYRICMNIDKWAETATNDEIQRSADTLFKIVERIGVDDLAEVLGNLTKYIPMITKSYKNSDREEKREVKRVLGILLLGRIDDEKNNPDGIDWDEIECLMNDYEIRQFAKDYNLFI